MERDCKRRDGGTERDRERMIGSDTQRQWDGWTESEREVRWRETEREEMQAERE